MITMTNNSMESETLSRVIIVIVSYISTITHVDFFMFKTHSKTMSLSLTPLFMAKSWKYFSLDVYLVLRNRYLYRPVQIGGQEDEADAMFRMPVEH